MATSGSTVVDGNGGDGCSGKAEGRGSVAVTTAATAAAKLMARQRSGDSGD